MGRRSPGRRGGRAPGTPGRGRWKIGCPGTGRPGAGRAAALGAAGDCGGALYTGRGPVWGTITRRCGGVGAADVAGLVGGVAAGAGGAAWAAGADGAEASAVCGGALGPEGRCTGPTTTGEAAGAGATGGGTTEAGGRGCGTTNLGCGGGAAGGLAAGGWAGAGGADVATAGSFSTGVGATGRGRAATGAACCLLINFRTSPGLEIWERSILVLISSASARARVLFDAACDSAARRKCARTFSASCSSSELE